MTTHSWLDNLISTGVTSHNNLTGRDAFNAHPATATSIVPRSNPNSTILGAANVEEALSLIDIAIFEIRNRLPPLPPTIEITYPTDGAVIEAAIGDTLTMTYVATYTDNVDPQAFMSPDEQPPQWTSMMGFISDSGPGFFSSIVIPQMADDSILFRLVAIGPGGTTISNVVNYTLVITGGGPT